MEFAKTDAFLRDWLTRVKLRKSDETIKRYDQVSEEFLTYLGKRASTPLSEISSADIQGYLDSGLAAGKKPKTARNEAKILNVPFAFAHRQGLILANPVASADIPDDSGESKSPFTSAQVSSIILDPAVEKLRRPVLATNDLG
jgi:site-specific recombinase XerD